MASRPVKLGLDTDAHLWVQVPNIKFNVAKMLERLVPLVDASVVQVRAPNLALISQ